MSLLLALFALSSVASPVARDKPVGQEQPSVFPASNIDRPPRYTPVGTDFVITNGTEFFNRPLYCLNSTFHVEGGDKPESSVYLPGRDGNLRFGIKISADVKWLNAADKIIARYRPGLMVYEIQDALLAGGKLDLTVLPLRETKGMIARVGLRGTRLPVELLSAFGARK